MDSFREIANLCAQLEALRALDGFDVLETAVSSPVTAAYSPTRIPNPADDADLQEAFGELVQRLEKQESIAKDYRDGVQILKFLKDSDFDSRFVKEFSAIVNMVKHMHVMMFIKGKPKARLSITVMNDIKGIATQIIHYFDQIEHHLADELQKLKETAHELPTLNAKTDKHHLKTGLRMWVQNIAAYDSFLSSCRPSANRNSSLTPPRECEEQLWAAFRSFFHAQVYDSLNELRESKVKKHSFITLAEYFDEIDQYIPAIELLYKHLVKETKKLGEAMKSTRARMYLNPKRCLREYKEDLVYYVIQKKHASFAPSTSTTFVKDLAAMTDEELAEEQEDFTKLVRVLERKMELESEVVEIVEADATEQTKKWKRANTT